VRRTLKGATKGCQGDGLGKPISTSAKRSTIRPIDIEKAVGIVLPEEMAVHCINFCQKSLNKYSTS